jgi:hypothetical protein
MFTVLAHQQIGRVDARADTQTDLQKIEAQTKASRIIDSDSGDHDAA